MAFRENSILTHCQDFVPFFKHIQNSVTSVNVVCSNWKATNKERALEVII